MGALALMPVILLGVDAVAYWVVVISPFLIINWTGCIKDAGPKVAVGGRKLIPGVISIDIERRLVKGSPAVCNAGSPAYGVVAVTVL